MVCFGSRRNRCKAGDELDFKYRPLLERAAAGAFPLANVYATRTGMGGFPDGLGAWAKITRKCGARRFAIDFVGGDLKAAAPKGIEPVITLSSGEAKQVEILLRRAIRRYRILFDWYPTSDSTEPVDMRPFLCCQGDAISETRCTSISRPRRINVSTLTTGSCVNPYGFVPGGGFWP